MKKGKKLNMKGKRMMNICISAKNDVVNGNEQKLDHVSDTSHNGKTNGA